MRQFLIYCLDEVGKVTDAERFTGTLDEAKARAESRLTSTYRVEVWESAVCLFRAGAPPKEL